jgi:hypothetical protein
MNLTSRRYYSASIVAFAFLAAALPALNSHAGPINSESVPTISVSVDSFAGPPWEYSPALDALEMASGQGRGKKLGMPMAFGAILGNRANVVIEDLEFDPDPFVVNNLLVTNTTSTTQFYTVGIALPTTFGAPNIISGSVLTGVIDTSGNGTATIATVGAGQPIYSAQIDFNTVATLQDHPFSLSVAPPDVLASASDSFGPTLSNVPVNSSIGIQLRFSLTAGDTATILSRFDVVIPEPASAGLFLIGLLGVIAGWRRR